MKLTIVVFTFQALHCTKMSEGEEKAAEDFKNELLAELQAQSFQEPPFFDLLNEVPGAEYVGNKNDLVDKNPNPKQFILQRDDDGRLHVGTYIQ